MAAGLRGSETGEAAMLSGSMAPAGGRAAGSRDGRRSREEDIRDVWGGYSRRHEGRRDGKHGGRRMTRLEEAGGRTDEEIYGGSERDDAEGLNGGS